MLKRLQAENAGQLGCALVDLVAAFQTAGVEMDVGPAVERLTRRKGLNNERAQLSIVHVCNQRALAAGRRYCQTQENTVDRGVEPHHVAVGEHKVHIAQVARSSAAAGYYHVLEFAQFVKHVSLNIAEPLLAVVGKQL